MSVPAPEATAPAAPVVPAVPAAPVAPVTPAVPVGDPPATEEPLGAPGLKALQAERDARAAAEKANADLAAKVKEFEDRDKSEAEKAAERLAASEKAAADAQIQLARYKVAAEKGVDADLLTGNDEDAMRAAADKLLAWRGDPKPAVPKPDPAQGARPGVTDIDAEIKEAQDKRDFVRVISLREQKAAASKPKL
jgi:hypothetical protein